MKYLLDTDICIYIIKQKPIKVFEKLKTIPPYHVGISAITLAEMEFGVANSLHKEKNQTALNLFTSTIDVIPFDDNAAISYGSIRLHLQKLGTPIGPLDLLIAAHAKSINAILVTNNHKEYSRVTGLVIENWAA